MNASSDRPVKNFSSLAIKKNDGDGVIRSSLVSRNITIDSHRTSIRLEPDMWNGLREICRREHATMHEICSTISAHKSANTSLTAAIRVFIMTYFRAASTEDGHSKAGHGPGGYFMVSQKQAASPALVQSAFQTPPPGRDQRPFTSR